MPEFCVLLLETYANAATSKLTLRVTINIAREQYKTR
jgi:hypothetical protein